MKTYLVSYYADSYQFKASTMHEVSEILYDEEMPKLRKEIEASLAASKAGSTVKETFWASFSEWNNEINRWIESEENFKLRIRV